MTNAMGDDRIPGSDAGFRVGDVDDHEGARRSRPRLVTIGDAYAHGLIHPHTLERLSLDDGSSTHPRPDNAGGVPGEQGAPPDANDHAGKLRRQAAVVTPRRGLRVVDRDAGVVPVTRTGDVVSNGAGADLDAVEDS